MSFFKAEDLPEGILLRDPSHLRQEEVFTLWELWTSRQKDGLVGLIFSGCDPRDKRKDMGKKLTWKAKGKRLNLAGDDCSSSSSSDGEDEEYSGDAVGPGVGSLCKGKGKSADRKDDNNTGGPHMGDPDPDQGSQGIDAPDQVDLAEFLHDIQAPAETGDSKEERLFFLGALSKEVTYQAMVQWLKDNLVPIFPLLYCHCE